MLMYFWKRTRFFYEKILWPYLCYAIIDKEKNVSLFSWYLLITLKNPFKEHFFVNVQHYVLIQNFTAKTLFYEWIAVDIEIFDTGRFIMNGPQILIRIYFKINLHLNEGYKYYWNASRNLTVIIIEYSFWCTFGDRYLYVMKAVANCE